MKTGGFVLILNFASIISVFLRETAKCQIICLHFLNFDEFFWQNVSSLSAVKVRKSCEVSVTRPFFFLCFQKSSNFRAVLKKTQMQRNQDVFQEEEKD